ncbi:hypothetical protein Gorai_010313 [Gossypium raimondii]|uniref:Bifunctional inhibitor/plant lipid transfer protein/seed storage helical domain-containing protein n=1 Tax=Gossypium raimondii TaxID=29730 RepID=A0A7J8PVZ5_GOSRA|nr:hypothetical protein [Gossypium raimondii]
MVKYSRVAVASHEFYYDTLDEHRSIRHSPVSENKFIADKAGKTEWKGSSKSKQLVRRSWCLVLLTVTTPRPNLRTTADCCNPIREAVANELPCLCNLYKDPTLLAFFNVTVAEALRISRECGITTDLSACNGMCLTNFVFQLLLLLLRLLHPRQPILGLDTPFFSSLQRAYALQQDALSKNSAT